MRNLKDFISPNLTKTPPMSVQVIDTNGKTIQSFDAPAGFQLERYVDAVYPDNVFMVYQTAKEVNISVFSGEDIFEIYRGVYK